jgi:hypothetical protein
VKGWSKIEKFLTSEAPRYGVRTDRSSEWDICIVGGTSDAGMSGNARLVVALPDASDSVVAQRRIEIVYGIPVGEIVIVPGTARVVNGSHVLTAETYGRLRRAEKIARRRQIRALILSGWNGHIEGCQSEAVQMFNAWRGPQVPMILDEAARTTAENALWSAVFAEALGGVRRVRVVTSWVSALRLGLASIVAFRSVRIIPILSVVWGCVQAASWRPALFGLVHLRRHIRMGRAAIVNGVHHRQARP